MEHKKAIAGAGFVATILVGVLIGFWLFKRQEVAPVVAPTVKEEPIVVTPPEYLDNLDQAFLDLEAIDL